MKNYITNEEVARLENLYEKKLITRSEYEERRNEYYTQKGVNREIIKEIRTLNRASAELSTMLGIEGLPERIGRMEGGEETAEKMKDIVRKFREARKLIYECGNELAEIHDSYASRVKM